MLVAPDTSPRGVPLPGDGDSWDFGVGAGFYLDATQAPWSKHYRMYSYVTAELPAIIDEHFPGDTKRQGICGHSMGGHGALTIGLKNPGNRYRSISAFAPIAAPKEVPWGQKALQQLPRPRSVPLESVRCYRTDEGARRCERAAGHPDRSGLADQFLENQLHRIDSKTPAGRLDRHSPCAASPGTTTATISSLRLLMTICVIMLVYWDSR